MRLAKAAPNQGVRSLMVGVSLSLLDYSRTVEREVDIEQRCAHIDADAIHACVASMGAACSQLYGQRLAILGLFSLLK